MLHFGKLGKLRSGNGKKKKVESIIGILKNRSLLLEISLVLKDNKTTKT